MLLIVLDPAFSFLSMTVKVGQAGGTKHFLVYIRNCAVGIVVGGLVAMILNWMV